MRSHNFIDLTGQKFGRLTVQSLSQEPRKSDTKWICLCDCGRTSTVGSQNLKGGMTKSCGCLKTERITTHGLSHTQEWQIWRGIMDRCHSESYSKSKPKVWARYGGRGIAVAKEWHDFVTFYRDIGPRPDKSMTVEREDNNGPYAQWNCKWANRIEQGRNRRDNALYLYQGEKLTLAQIMERRKTDVPYFVASARMHDGWDLEDALTYPRYKHRPRGTRKPKSVEGKRWVRSKKQTNLDPETSSSPPQSEQT